VSAKVIDGKAIAAEMRNEVAVRVDRLKSRGVVPGLAVVIVGDDPASQVYVRNKALASGAVGMHSEVHAMSGDTSQSQLIAFVRALNANPAVHGILVQLPLPRHVDARAVVASIAPEKDVDGFHPVNLGNLLAGKPTTVACTPAGCMEILDHYKAELTGAEAVVIGRSRIVGKPLAQLLLARHATVTTCHTRTRDLAAHTRRADILCVAAGKPHVVTGDMVKPGAWVIDVGINRMPDGKLAGDVDFASVEKVAHAVTPVPGGVGPMTIAMLLKNTLAAAERQTGGA
jgi:methylenetetrahydrofolate dehydrogenase (NADP+)/methenyltetrahydrofolate cyclohydrolase